MALWGKNDQDNNKPKYLSDTLRNDQDVSDKDSTYGVDSGSPRYEAQLSENRAKGIKTPGWVQYHTYVDSEGNTRHKAEVLVAMNTVVGDAADDSVVADD